ncbi:MAG: hypothetical protein K6B72_02385 [Lachnospiraceae bacterium]|nr:hypothetical protein [Lachnospiraceae bacterium]
MNEEFDISLDELGQFIEDCREIDIDMDQFIAYQKHQYEKASEMEIFDGMASDMRACISQGKLNEAAGLAEKLKACDYGDFRTDIDACCRRCADAGIISAIKHMALKYRNGADGLPDPDAFPYLKKLSDLGYVKSFKLLGNCHLQGIGCEISYEHAAEEFMKGYVFAEDTHCMEMLVQIMKKRGLEGTKIRSLYEKLFHDGKPALSRNQIAVMAYTREISDYPPEAAYYLLFNLYRNYTYACDEEECYGDIPFYLSKCILDGLGIDPCPVLAEYVLRDAEDDYTWWMRDGHSRENTKLDQVEDLLGYVKKHMELTGYPNGDDLYLDWLDEEMEFVYNNPNSTMQHYELFGDCYNSSLICIDRNVNVVPACQSQ